MLGRDAEFFPQRDGFSVPVQHPLILLHDLPGNVETVKALRTVIPALLERGFRFTTCRNLFKEKGVTPLRGRMYSNVLAPLPI